jgi:hypothetical protein
MIRRTVFALAFVLGLALPAAADFRAEQDAEITEILRLVSEGVPQEIVLKHIDASGFVFDLTADDILALRETGVSDAIIEAMIDTALNEEAPAPQRAVDAEEDDSRGYVSLSAGYFSPWYHYPYAWGFYYDPFPVYYSMYYYPFAFCASWGWYGGCSYYYPGCWNRYRYGDPWYWNTAAHQGRPVYVPHHANPSRWQSGRGLDARRPAPQSRLRPDSPQTPPAQFVREGSRVRAPRRVEVARRDRTYVRASGSRAPTVVDRPRGRGGANVQEPRRTQQALGAPAPRTASGRTSTPAMRPPSGRAAPAATRTPHLSSFGANARGFHAAPPRMSAPAAPRGSLGGARPR